MKSYLEMLKEAYEKLKSIQVVKSERRLEIPMPKITYQKNWTVIMNIKEFSSTFNRDIKLIAKFLQTEYNAPVKIEDQKLIIMKKVSFENLQEKMRKFAKEFVICPVCGKPDTILVKKDRILYIKCLACGAESPVLYKIR